MGSNCYGYAHLCFNQFGYFVQVNGARSCFAGLKNTGAKVNGIDIPFQVISLFEREILTSSCLANSPSLSSAALKHLRQDTQFMSLILLHVTIKTFANVPLPFLSYIFFILTRQSSRNCQSLMIIGAYFLSRVFMVK